MWIWSLPPPVNGILLKERLLKDNALAFKSKI